MKTRVFIAVACLCLAPGVLGQLLPVTLDRTCTLQVGSHAPRLIHDGDPSYSYSDVLGDQESGATFFAQAFSDKGGQISSLGLTLSGSVRATLQATTLNPGRAVSAVSRLDFVFDVLSPMPCGVQTTASGTASGTQQITGEAYAASASAWLRLERLEEDGALTLLMSADRTLAKGDFTSSGTRFDLTNVCLSYEFQPGRYRLSAEACVVMSAGTGDLISNTAATSWYVSMMGVPEPGTLVLLMLAATWGAGCWGRTRRRR